MLNLNNYPHSTQLGFLSLNCTINGISSVTLLMNPFFRSSPITSYFCAISVKLVLQITLNITLNAYLYKFILSYAAICWMPLFLGKDNSQNSWKTLLLIGFLMVTVEVVMGLYILGANLRFLARDKKRPIIPWFILLTHTLCHLASIH